VSSINLAEAGSLTGDLLAANSPIRALLHHADQIGAVYRLADFHEALVITNDKFVHDAHGVPLHAFLLATTSDLADPTTAGRTDPDDEEIVLLRVIGTTPLPQENDLQFLRAQAGMELVVEDGRQSPRPRGQILDPLTEDRMQTAGLKCAVLGTFYDADGPAGPRLEFGADVDNVYASSRLRVYKPYGHSLATIASFMAEQTGDEPRRPFRIGNVRYASTRRRERNAARASKPVDVPVHIDIADLVAHKTAVLGMTRKGKSNTVKVIAATTHQYGREHDLTIGQLIFDPAGEYAYVNDQDKTALAEIGAEHVIRYRLGATRTELAADAGLRSLAINFFDEDAIGIVWSLVGAFVTRLNRGQFVQAFAAADVEGIANPQTRDDWRQVTRARRARMMLYATFLRAGIRPAAGWGMWCPLKQSLRLALTAAGGRRGEELSFLDGAPTSKRGDQVRLDAPQLLLVCEALGSHHFGGGADEDIHDWMSVPDVEHVADMLLARKGGGWKVLLPLREGYHSPAAGDDYAPAIHADLVAGKIVIVDLSRGSEGVLQFASERILNALLSRASERFRSGKEPQRIQIFLEEAHRLFDRERFTDRLADADPYVRLAREAGKYKLGLIYSTQQVSSVEPDVLDNTANWIIAHLNSESEVRLLRGRYEFDRFAEQILRAEDVGFVRIKTQSSRFVVPVQVRMFDAAMVRAAREAAPGVLRPASGA
jgi:hypothetical protein